MRCLTALSLIIFGLSLNYFFDLPNKPLLSKAKDFNHLNMHTIAHTSDLNLSHLTTNIDNQQGKIAPLSIAQIRKLPTEFMQYYESYHLALNSSQIQLQSLIIESLSLEHENERYGLAGIFINRYVILNPQKAMSFFYSLFDIKDQEVRLLYGMYHEWAWMDMTSALTHLNSIASSDLKEKIVMYLMRTSYFPEKEKLHLMAESLSPEHKNVLIWQQAFKNGAESAFMTFLALPKSESKRSQWLSAAVRKWSKVDPEAAFSQVQKIQSQNLRQMLCAIALTQWINQEPETALLAAMEQDKNGGDLYRSALSELAVVNAQKALALINKYRDHLPQNVTEMVLAQWSHVQPEQAADYVMLNHSDMSMREIQNVATSYVRDSPVNAYLWATEIGLSDQVLQAMDINLVNTNLNVAEQKLKSLDSGKRRNNLLRSIAGEKGRSYPEQALSWLDNYKAEGGFNSAKNEIYTTWMYNAPSQAAKSIVQSKENVKYINRLVNIWYRQKPQKAQQWALDLDDNDLRDNALDQLIKSVMKSDKEKAMLLVMELSNDTKQQVWISRLGN